MQTYLNALIIAAATLFSQAVAQNSFQMVPPEPPNGGEVAAIGAEPADPSDWEATFIFFSAGGRCTSTAIGTRVVLTAAHCVENNAEGTILVNGTPVTLVCERHPRYIFNITADYALCLTDSELTSIIFENISSSLAYAKKDQEVILLGFGCTKEGGTDRDNRVLHEGPASIVETPDQIGYLYTVTDGGAALCFGDSGGASFFYTDPNEINRVIIGVNSRGDISKVSYLSTTATPLFVNWALEWSQRTGAPICGMVPNAEGCRR